MSEFAMLKKGDHPHILQIFEMFENERYFYLVTEVLDGGEVYERIIEKQLFDEELCRNVIK